MEPCTGITAGPGTDVFMKNKLLPWLAAALVLVSLAWVAQNTGYNANQFDTATAGKIAIKSGASLTNLAVTSTGLGPSLSLDGSGILIGAPFIGQSGFVLQLRSNLVVTVNADSTNGVRAGKMQCTNAPVAVSDVVNLGYLSALNLTGANVSSIAIPMGAWFVNGVAIAPLSAATATTVTNSSDGYSFADAITNVIRSRFALPWDWDGNSVEVEIQACCQGPNGTTASNVVFAVRAAALGDGDRADSATFGTAISVTNHISTNSFILRSAITGPITVGNTPGATKSILWEVQRWGADAGDNLTNVLGATVTEVRIYYGRTNRNDYPVLPP